MKLNAQRFYIGVTDTSRGKVAVTKKKTAKQPDPYKRDLAERIAAAFKQYNAKVRRDAELTQVDLGRLVARRLKLDGPISQAAVSGWMNPENPSAPDNPTLEAIADVLECSKMWLAFGAPKQ